MLRATSTFPCLHLNWNKGQGRNPILVSSRVPGVFTKRKLPHPACDVPQVNTDATRSEDLSIILRHTHAAELLVYPATYHFFSRCLAAYAPNLHTSVPGTRDGVLSHLRKYDTQKPHPYVLGKHIFRQLKPDFDTNQSFKRPSREADNKRPKSCFPSKFSNFCGSEATDKSVTQVLCCAMMPTFSSDSFSSDTMNTKPGKKRTPRATNGLWDCWWLLCVCVSVSL